MTAPHVEDFTVGMEAPERRHLLTRTDLVRYAGASGDFNPMHHDEIQAVGAGQPSTFGHGMLSMGFLGTALTCFVGPGRVVDYSVRFSRQTWPGEELVTHVVVRAIRSEREAHLVDLDVSLTNAEGEVKVVGSATASLPSRT